MDLAWLDFFLGGMVFPVFLTSHCLAGILAVAQDGRCLKWSVFLANNVNVSVTVLRVTSQVATLGQSLQSMTALLNNS